jgi:polyisoprenyl-phosphate glycosyltransferase
VLGSKLISIIVPIYNEAPNVPKLYAAFQEVLQPLPYHFELIFIDDGSSDDSVEVLSQLANTDAGVRVVELARNFGKEAATTAGLHAARGDAALMIDADLQHPPELIGLFVAKWEAGADVVVGVRQKCKSDTVLHRLSSSLFYKALNLISETKITPSATDYRLIDRVVIDEYNRFTERNRITRGLIDWLGFKRDYVLFKAKPRLEGKAGYSYRALIRLAMHSFVGHSLFPLRLAGYLGALLMLLAGPLGLFIFVEKYLLGDPLGYAFTGSAILGVILVFLVGVILVSLGLIALYIASIHGETTNRPLYVVRRRKQ